MTSYYFIASDSADPEVLADREATLRELDRHWEVDSGQGLWEGEKEPCWVTRRSAPLPIHQLQYLCEEARRWGQAEVWAVHLNKFGDHTLLVAHEAYGAEALRRAREQGIEGCCVLPDGRLYEVSKDPSYEASHYASSAHLSCVLEKYHTRNLE